MNFVIVVDGKYFSDKSKWPLNAESQWPWSNNVSEATLWDTYEAAESVALYWKHKGLSLEEARKIVLEKQNGTKNIPANPTYMMKDLLESRSSVFIGGVICDNPMVIEIGL